MQQQSKSKNHKKLNKTKSKSKNPPKQNPQKLKKPQTKTKNIEKETKNKKKTQEQKKLRCRDLRHLYSLYAYIILGYRVLSSEGNMCPVGRQKVPRS